MSHALRKDTIDPLWVVFRSLCDEDKQKEFVGLMQGNEPTMCLKKTSNKTKAQFLELNGSIQLTNIDGSNQLKI